MNYGSTTWLNHGSTTDVQPCYNHGSLTTVQSWLYHGSPYRGGYYHGTLILMKWKQVTGSIEKHRKNIDNIDILLNYLHALLATDDDTDDAVL